MGNGHDGLNRVIAVHKRKNPLFAKTLQIEAGLILFLNRARTKCKLMGENQAVMGYCRLPGGAKLTQKAIDQIPAVFGGSLEHSKATQRALKALLAVEERTTAKPSVLYAEG